MIAKLEQALAHHQEAWDLVIDWSGAWQGDAPYPPGKAMADWMVEMAFVGSTIQQLIDQENGLAGKNSTNDCH